MERSEQRSIVEAIVFASPEPIALARIAQIVPDCPASLARELIAELNEVYLKQDASFEIWEVAGGFHFRTKAEFSGYLQQLQKQRPLRLSRAALETLAIVAYKQPATRAEIEDVRGVDVGAVVKSLLDRQLVRITGHKDVPGRPMLYGTTRRFLEVFGLDSLKSLPTLRELEELMRERAARAAAEDEVPVEDETPQAESARQAGSEAGESDSTLEGRTA